MNQQIYLPISGLYPIPYEFEENTMPVPRGEFSVVSELMNGQLTAAETMIYFCLNHGSTWNSGVTWNMSGTYLSKILGTGMSKSYALKILSRLTDKGWVQRLPKKNNLLGNQYQIRHYLCDADDVPVNENGKPLKFMVPRGLGGPLERCFNGDISWKAAFVWIMLKYRSNWKAHEETSGQTESAKLRDLSQRCRITLSHFQKIVTELTQAGMLHRLTPKSQKAVFQLYPKPFAKPVQSTSPRYHESVPGIEGGVIQTDGEYYYSHNNQYRCSRETEKIERRQRGGTWKQVSDHHKSQVMPQRIVADFKCAIDIKNLLESILSS